VFDVGRVIAGGTPQELKQRVGSQTLQVRPVDPDRLADVTAALLDIAGQAPESPSRGVLSVPVHGDEQLHALVERLTAEHISVTELALRLPSLDEAFFALTGHRATADDDITTTKDAA
jgi:oleandomycin transport system ATP-binding protein